MNYNWNWHIFLEPNPMGTGTYLDLLLAGLVVTIKVSVLAWIIALVSGSVIGVLRTLPSRTASWIGFCWVEFFRNMPLLVQLFLWFFVLPELLPRSAGLWLKQLPNAPFWTAAIGVGFFMSARVAVQLQAGITSLPRGQKQASTALGLTTVQTYRYVLLPMAFRIILPPLTSEFLNTIKNSAVAITIGLIELTGQARSMQEFSFQVFEAFTAATVLYLLLNFVVVTAMRFLERYVAIPGYITGK
ncbi:MULTISPECIES: amino acid ABC transporter permease [Bradyrhizobium]|uniref:Amino acid ABC transporter permease n=1 Tax=Bradyrhizobium elkanii TaxID=29448 RepID=A0A1E3EL84_BRAEL|nr:MULTISPECIES: amino acid ABC transporter permease [Bradyrhizobium]MTV16540.1 amino acid ABC transporter permease [Bradyrhizobium sp. BR2003]MBP1290874.1 glutamate/aspartate transport system permease protein [Bradyrhizobium elkanii]MBP2429411.1 glutamate/aspartate transport system permease protein [Bradyrhizobium elkanii]MCP1737117.1 glutamate/aspartate transport system permease protein [Bradyrhizobium elkanii]MCP1755163.1 glutamate/aspartate transport system permease protein [Bradyrhizobium